MGQGSSPERSDRLGDRSGLWGFYPTPAPRLLVGRVGTGGDGLFGAEHRVAGGDLARLAEPWPPGHPAGEPGELLGARLGSRRSLPGGGGLLLQALDLRLELDSGRLAVAVAGSVQLGESGGDCAGERIGAAGEFIEVLVVGWQSGLRYPPAALEGVAFGGLVGSMDLAALAEAGVQLGEDLSAAVALHQRLLESLANRAGGHVVCGRQRLRPRPVAGVVGAADDEGRDGGWGLRERAHRPQPPRRVASPLARSQELNWSLVLGGRSGSERSRAPPSGPPARSRLESVEGRTGAKGKRAPKAARGVGCALIRAILPSERCPVKHCALREAPEQGQPASGSLVLSQPWPRPQRALAGGRGVGRPARRVGWSCAP